ncbi:hypothetical protein NDU88_000644 [Pleurodeles waltl]|uniref:Uncharacterized protein n=1 Tax=Pleurodeles waltl TaxID=8319 RepID=A0AAV7S7I8_PLEWA|nr:hypothetical protein NDU88_000644 [Pleurodeles waltl]
MLSPGQPATLPVCQSAPKEEPLESVSALGPSDVRIRASSVPGWDSASIESMSTPRAGWVEWPELRRAPDGSLIQESGAGGPCGGWCGLKRPAPHGLPRRTRGVSRGAVADPGQRGAQQCAESQ